MLRLHLRTGRGARDDQGHQVEVGAAARPEMQPELASILRMCHYPLSMAEISAYLKLPFSVVAVLVSDLLADSSVEVRATVRTAGIPDPELLKAVMYGLQKL